MSEKSKSLRITRVMPTTNLQKKPEKIDILKATQFIQFYYNNAPHKVGDAPLSLTYGSNSGLPVTFTSDPPALWKLMMDTYIFSRREEQ